MESIRNTLTNTKSRQQQCHLGGGRWDFVISGMAGRGPSALRKLALRWYISVRRTRCRAGGMVTFGYRAAKKPGRAEGFVVGTSYRFPRSNSLNKEASFVALSDLEPHVTHQPLAKILNTVRNK